MRSRLKMRAVVSPLRRAAVLAISYILLCVVYIWMSGRIAAAYADSVETLKRIEAIKGTLFILCSGGLLFMFSYYQLRRIASQADELMVQKNALVLLDRRAMAGSLALSIAHDFNNQIMGLQLSIEELQVSSLRPADKRYAHLKAVILDLIRLNRRLMNMGRESLLMDFTQCSIQELFDESMDNLLRHPRTRDCVIRASIAPGLHAEVNPGILSQLFLNLILNAADATGGKGQVEIRAREDLNVLILEVHDNGPGIPPDMREKVLQPFFTTKAHGHGLGFASVQACAQIHSGTVEIDDSDLGGACIRINLPAHKTAGPDRTSPALAARLAHAPATPG